MRPFTLGTVFLYLIAVAYQEPIEKLENVLVYPVEPATKKSKRDIGDNKQSDLNHFIEDKLIEHTQALEYVVKLLNKNEEISQRLLDALSQKVVEPKLPEKIEVQQNSRRSGVVESDDEHPIVRIIKNIPKYGEIVKNMITAEFRSNEEPVVVEQHIIV